MTGLYEQSPGEGHNRPPVEDKEGKWERWSKKRTFVRELAGTYSEVYKELLEQPRVYSSRNHPWKGGPALYGKHVISPQAANVVQSIETHIECYAPGAYGQKHGHLNSAVFYVLKGRGHDVHDGRRIEWKAGDIMIVECGCVHQHFNDDPENEAILLVFKAKPLFLFMHLLFQKIVTYPPTEPAPGQNRAGAGGHNPSRAGTGGTTRARSTGGTTRAGAHGHARQALTPLGPAGRPVAPQGRRSLPDGTNISARAGTR